MPDSQSRNDFFKRLTAGTPSAFEEMDRRYREQLCRLVEREMANRFSAREDPEDLVQSAFRSFHRGMAGGKFEIASSADLWALLATITRHKILKHVDYHLAQKRRPDAEVGLPGDILPGRDPSPSDAAIAIDLMETVLAGLDPSYGEVFWLRLQGYTRAEIMDRVGLSRAELENRLERIAKRLRKLLATDSDP